MKKNYLIPLLIGISSFSYAGEGKISAKIQNMNGKAGEYVYAQTNGDKVSYLRWDIKNVPVLNLGYNYTINNFEFSIIGKKNISKNYRSGSMKDYDWFSTKEESDDDEGIAWFVGTKEQAEAKKRDGIDEIVMQDDGSYVVRYIPSDKDRGSLSNFSENKNYVKNIMGLDLSIKYYIKNSEKLKLSTALGVDYDKYEFYALSGDQRNYIPGIGYTIDKGQGIKGITYKQRFMTPYIGFNSVYTPNNRWEFSFGLKGSVLGRARATDKHLERGSFETVETYKNLKYLSSNLQAKYNWTDNFSINSGIEFVKHFKSNKSTVRLTPDEVTAESSIETIKNIGGISNYNISYNLGFEYKF